jgi:hypothetical protein
MVQKFSGQKFTEEFAVAVTHQHSSGGWLLFSHAGDEPGTVRFGYMVNKVVSELGFLRIFQFNSKS